MDIDKRIIEASKKAVSLGKGNYYALPKTTWKDILSGYTQGLRVDDISEAELLSKIQLLEV